MNGRLLLAGAACTAVASFLDAKALQARRKPNFVVILCDDLGFGDINLSGKGAISTPHIVRMAREGTVLTDYYAPANLYSLQGRATHRPVCRAHGARLRSYKRERRAGPAAA